jgi:O-acetyl-ADP-ribose deacetylase (regulator of RNase III)
MAHLPAQPCLPAELLIPETRNVMPRKTMRLQTRATMQGTKTLTTAPKTQADPDRINGRWKLAAVVAYNGSVMSGEGFVHGFQIDAGHSLHIFRGNLTSVHADALVSWDDDCLSASSGVSAGLASAAGRDIRREYEKVVRERHPVLGDVVRTSAGALPCRYLYHAITIDFARRATLDESALRSIVANVFDQATRDAVRTLGMPAIGTASAFHDLDRAAEIIMNELLVRFVKTPIERVVLALPGDRPEQSYYVRLVRAQADRCAASLLRLRESGLGNIRRPVRTRGSSVVSRQTVTHSATRSATQQPLAVEFGETVEQFPDLVDEERLAASSPGRPRLVEGLAELILKYAPAEEIEQELLSSPSCYGFRGTIKARLMEFLYLSEDNLRTALGPALFRNRDLRRMADELGEDTELVNDQVQLVNVILRALCFNLVTPPQGINSYISRVEELQSELRTCEQGPRTIARVIMEAGKILERTLKNLLQMYGWLLWGADYETQLVGRSIIPARRGDAGTWRMTIGQARDGLLKMDALVKRDDTLGDRLRASGRSEAALLPHRVVDLGCSQALQAIINLRNVVVHDQDEGNEGKTAVEPAAVMQALDQLHAFFCECQRGGFYPDVLRYEGIFENRDGERFVHFVDERGRARKVRTDERIDARRHYYCFATNNPVHLFPTLIPKG